MSEDSLSNTMSPLAQQLLSTTDDQDATMNEGRERGLIECTPEQRGQLRRVCTGAGLLDELVTVAAG